MSDQITTSQSGSKSSREPDFTLLPTSGLLRAIERFELGSAKYGRGNWKAAAKGQDKAFLLERLGHAIKHLYELRDLIEAGETTEGHEDHIGAVLWFGFFAAEYEAQGRNSE